jgi:hypothetical protein
MRLAWCDKIALVWLLFLILAISFLQQPGGFENSLRPENIGGGWGALLWKLVAIPWLVLRGIDLLLGGPWRRRGVVTVHRLD